jgi:hypothetical protein
VRDIRGLKKQLRLLDKEEHDESWLLETSKAILERMDAADAKMFLGGIIGPVDSSTAESSRQWMLQCLETRPEARYILGYLLRLYLMSAIFNQTDVLVLEPLTQQQLSYILPPAAAQC